jgi:hypothetical protein
MGSDFVFVMIRKQLSILYIQSLYHCDKQKDTDYFEVLIIDYMRRCIHACVMNSHARVHKMHAIFVGCTHAPDQIPIQIIFLTTFYFVFCPKQLTHSFYDSQNFSVFFCIFLWLVSLYVLYSLYELAACIT